jgi:DNA-binding NarL/FixJ family response regulator
MRVLLVDDHKIIRDGLKMLLSLESDFTVVGEASDLPAARSLIIQLHPDLLVVDLNLPSGDGSELIHLARSQPWVIRTVVLTGAIDQETVTRTMALGADGYVTKAESADDLVIALRRVVTGEAYVSASVAKAIPANRSAKFAELSDRERDVLHCMVRGLRAAEIADDLEISLGTVNKHRENFYRKLGVRSAAEAVAIALRAGM